VVLFDPFAYMARNADLAAAYAGDPLAATLHHIQLGFAEGRVWA
jgi:hypothetical protein